MGISSQSRIVGAEVVVIQAGLGIEILARETEVVGDVDAVAIRVFTDRGNPERRLGHLPHLRAVAVGHRLWRAQMIIVMPVGGLHGDRGLTPGGGGVPPPPPEPPPEPPPTTEI